MPAKETMAEAGTSTTGRAAAVTTSASTKEPARSAPSGLGTSASTFSVRSDWSMAGLTRATRPP